MNQPAPAHPGSLRLGLRANLAQFSLLVGVNALVGGMVGQERSLLSLLATQVFGRDNRAGLAGKATTRSPPGLGAGRW